MNNPDIFSYIRELLVELFWQASAAINFVVNKAETVKVEAVDRRLSLGSSSPYGVQGEFEGFISSSKRNTQIYG